MEFLVLVFRLALVLVYIGFAIKGLLWLLFCIKHKS